MTDVIAVTPEKLREISRQMSIGAVDVQEILAGLSAEVAPVRTEWVGTAQAHFDTMWGKLEADASGLHLALTGIAKLTEKAARAYEAAEESIVKSFDAFRVERDLIEATAGAFDDLAELLAEFKVGAATPVGVEASTIDAVTTVDAESTVDVETTVDAESTESHTVTEVDGRSHEEVTRPVGRTRAGTRPWARFMTKTENTQTGKVFMDVRRRDRRFKATDPNLKPGTRLCRLCFTVVVLEPQYIESTATSDFLRCPHCEGSFPIRRSDVETIFQGKTRAV